MRVCIKLSNYQKKAEKEEEANSWSSNFAIIYIYVCFLKKFYINNFKSAKLRQYACICMYMKNNHIVFKKKKKKKKHKLKSNKNKQSRLE